MFVAAAVNVALSQGLAAHKPFNHEATGETSESLVVDVTTGRAPRMFMQVEKAGVSMAFSSAVWHDLSYVMVRYKLYSRLTQRALTVRGWRERLEREVVRWGKGNQ